MWLNQGTSHTMAWCDSRGVVKNNSMMWLNKRTSLTTLQCDPIKGLHTQFYACDSTKGNFITTSWCWLPSEGGSHSHVTMRINQRSSHPISWSDLIKGCHDTTSWCDSIKGHHRQCHDVDSRDIKNNITMWLTKRMSHTILQCDSTFRTSHLQRHDVTQPKDVTSTTSWCASIKRCQTQCHGMTKLKDVTHNVMMRLNQRTSRTMSSCDSSQVSCTHNVMMCLKGYQKQHHNVTK